MAPTTKSKKPATATNRAPDGRRLKLLAIGLANGVLVLAVSLVLVLMQFPARKAAPNGGTPANARQPSPPNEAMLLEPPTIAEYSPSLREASESPVSRAHRLYAELLRANPARNRELWAWVAGSEDPAVRAFRYALDVPELWYRSTISDLPAKAAVLHVSPAEDWLLVQTDDDVFQSRPLNAAAAPQTTTQFQNPHIRGRDQTISDVQFSPDGRRVMFTITVSITRGGIAEKMGTTATARVLNSRTLQEIRSVEMPREMPRWAVASFFDDDHILVLNREIRDGVPVLSISRAAISTGQTDTVRLPVDGTPKKSWLGREFLFFAVETGSKLQIKAVAIAPLESAFAGITTPAELPVLALEGESAHVVPQSQTDRFLVDHRWESKVCEAVDGEIRTVDTCRCNLSTMVNPRLTRDGRHIVYSTPARSESRSSHLTIAHTTTAQSRIVQAFGVRIADALLLGDGRLLLLDANGDIQVGDLLPEVPAATPASPRQRKPVMMQRYLADGKRVWRRFDGDHLPQQIIDAATGEVRHELAAPRNSIFPISAFAPAGVVAASTTVDREARDFPACVIAVFDVERAEPIAQFKFPKVRSSRASGEGYFMIEPAIPVAIAFDAQGDRMAVMCHEPDLGINRSRLWLFGERGTKFQFRAVQIDHPTLDMALHPSGHRIAIVTRFSHRVIVCELPAIDASQAPVSLESFELPTERALVQSLRFHPDGHTLIGATNDGKVLRWNLHTRQGVTTWRAPETATGLTSMAISPDGEILAIGSGTKISLWHIDSGMFIHSFTGQNFDFRPDNLAIRVDDREITVPAIDDPDLAVRIAGLCRVGFALELASADAVARAVRKFPRPMRHDTPADPARAEMWAAYWASYRILDSHARASGSLSTTEFDAHCQSLRDWLDAHTTHPAREMAGHRLQNLRDRFAPSE